MSTSTVTLFLAGLLLTFDVAAQETQSEKEHVPPDPPTAQDAHSMPYREMVRVMQMDDTHPYGKVLIDRLEWRDANGGDGLEWNAEAWYGNDDDKLWFKSEGNRSDGVTELARNELLWNRTFTRWWNLQAGVRHDSGIGESRNWAAFGVQGLAPGFFDVEATVYIGDAGRAAARLSVERNLLFTQRLILQPELELNAYSESDAARLIGSGISDLELGLRLRYEFRREFAMYVGVAWERRFGSTASFLRAAGENPDDLQALAGLRTWF